MDLQTEHIYLFIVRGVDLENTKKYFYNFMVNDSVLEYTVDLVIFARF